MPLTKKLFLKLIKKILICLILMSIICISTPVLIQAFRTGNPSVGELHRQPSVENEKEINVPLIDQPEADMYCLIKSEEDVISDEEKNISNIGEVSYDTTLDDAERRNTVDVSYDVTESASFERYTFMRADWSQFIPTMIATFVAFCLTLFSTYLYDNHKDDVQREIFIRDICKELNEMKSDLISINDIMHNNMYLNSMLWVNPLKTYIWDSHIDDNKTYLISGEKWYEELLAIYHIAREYNTWHMLRTDMILHNLSYSSIDKGIADLKEDLEKRINTINISNV